MRVQELALIKDLTFEVDGRGIVTKYKGETITCSSESIEKGREIFIMSSGWGEVERSYFFDCERTFTKQEVSQLLDDVLKECEETMTDDYYKQIDVEEYEFVDYVIPTSDIRSIIQTKKENL